VEDTLSLNIVKLQEGQLIIMHIRRNKVGLVAGVSELKSGVIRRSRVWSPLRA